MNASRLSSMLTKRVYCYTRAQLGVRTHMVARQLNCGQPFVICITGAQINASVNVTKNDVTELETYEALPTY